MRILYEDAAYQAGGILVRPPASANPGGNCTARPCFVSCSAGQRPVDRGVGMVRPAGMFQARASRLVRPFTTPGRHGWWVVNTAVLSTM